MLSEDLYIKIDPEKKKAITCAFCHIQAYIGQCQDKQRADIAVACEICPYSKNCFFDWLHIVQPLVELSDVRLTVLTSEQLQRPDTNQYDCDEGMDTLRCGNRSNR